MRSLQAPVYSPVRPVAALLCVASLAWVSVSCSALQTGTASGDEETACTSEAECSSAGRRATCRNGRCVCEPTCLTRDCGGDGCGGSCGSCGCGNRCRNGVCTAAIADVWVGSYECRQGRTGLTVEIHGNKDDVRALFTFYAHPSNPGVPTGEYILHGTYDCDGSLRLEPDRWLEQPRHYAMVGLSGTLGADGSTLEGEVIAESCGRFRLHR